MKSSIKAPLHDGVSRRSLMHFPIIIITGASSGIGKALLEAPTFSNMPEPVRIFNLSRQKPDIFLKKKGLTHIECDLQDYLQLSQGVGQVRNQIAEEKLTGPVLLVNNSGIGSYGKFAKLDPEHEQGMLRLNVLAPVAVAHAFLPLLKEHGGAMVNVASTASFQPTPFLASYGASKAFLRHWSLSIGEELRGSGVHVLCVCPGPTSTNFFKNAGFSKPILRDGFGQTAAEVAEAIWEALRKRKRLVVTGWKNKVIAAVASKLPIGFITWLSGAILRRIRAKAE